MKKLFTFSIVILILLVVFWISYNLVFKGVSTDKIESTSEDGGGVLSLISDKKESEIIYRLSSTAAISPEVDAEERRIIFYDKLNNAFKVINFDGSQESELVDKFLPKFNEVFWATNKTSVIGRADDGFYSYSIESRKIDKIKDNVDNVVWANLSNKILYKYYSSDVEERTLNISNPDGSNWKKIADLEYKDISIAPVPQTSMISYWNYPDKNISSELKLVSVVGEDAEVIMSGKFGADYLWSPDGSRLLMSFVSSDGKNLNLAVANSAGQASRELNIPTMVSKCVWSSDNENIFCALPSNISGDTLMPNDYQKGTFLSKDTFWKINIEDGRKSRVVDIEDISDVYDASDLLLSPREDMLFFINRYDENIYRIGL
ncbi:hypothetical protein ACFL2R_01735 [Patescibacteria group bacterium]